MKAPTTDDPATGAKPLADAIKAAERSLGMTQSSIWGVSLRGWLALITTVTVCIMSLQGISIEEPLKAGWVAALAFYFGQK